MIKYGDVEVSGCYAVVEFNKDNLIEWSRYYQKLLFLILHKLLIIYPFVKKQDGGKLALRFMKAEFKDMKKEFNSPHLDELLKMRGGKPVVKTKS